MHLQLQDVGAVEEAPANKEVYANNEVPATASKDKNILEVATAVEDVTVVLEAATEVEDEPVLGAVSVVEAPD